MQKFCFQIMMLHTLTEITLKNSTSITATLNVLIIVKIILF